MRSLRAAASKTTAIAAASTAAAGQFGWSPSPSPPPSSRAFASSARHNKAKDKTWSVKHVSLEPRDGAERTDPRRSRLLRPRTSHDATTSTNNNTVHETDIIADVAAAATAVPAGDGPVLYWCTRDRRADDNWALHRALELAAVGANPPRPVAMVVTVPALLTTLDHGGGGNGGGGGGSTSTSSLSAGHGNSDAMRLQYARQRCFVLRGLRELQETLLERGIPLFIVMHGEAHHQPRGGGGGGGVGGGGAGRAAHPKKSNGSRVEEVRDFYLRVTSIAPH